MNQTRYLQKGFTLVEIIIAGVILVLLFGGLMHIFSQFQRGFSKGEASAVLLQEGGIFLGTLRQDCINAVQDPRANPGQWQKCVLSTPRSLSFHRFKDRQGNIEQVEYRLEPASGKGGSITRFTNGKEDRRLINEHVSKLSWDVKTALYPGIASPVRQIWLNLDIELRRGKSGGRGAAPFRIHTKLFPTRLNQQINR